MESKPIEPLEFNEIFCNSLPDGFLKDGLRAANERRKKRIEEIGYPAYRAEYDAETERRLKQADLKFDAERAKKLLALSGLGEKFFTRTFNTFRTNRDNEKAHNACCDIANGKRTRGVTLSGPHGIGKTHLAAAIVNAMASRGRRAYFGNIVDITGAIKDSFKTGTDKVYKKLLDCELLALDDLGAEHTKTESGFIEELLYKIINHAYEGNKILVITTNLSDYDFTQRYGVRISSRLSEMNEWIDYEEADHRQGFDATDEPMPWDDREASHDRAY